MVHMQAATTFAAHTVSGDVCLQLQRAGVRSPVHCSCVLPSIPIRSMNCCLLICVSIPLWSLSLLPLCEGSAVSSSVAASHCGDPAPQTLYPNAKHGSKRIELHVVKMFW